MYSQGTAVKFMQIRLNFHHKNTKVRRQSLSKALIVCLIPTKTLCLEENDLILILLITQVLHSSHGNSFL